MKGKRIVTTIFIFIALSLLMSIFACAGDAGIEKTDRDTEKPETQGEPETVPESDTGAKPASEPAPSKEEEAAPTADLKAGSADDGEGVDFMEMEESESEPSEKGAGERTKTSASSRSTPSASGLQAGFADDNKQYGYFLSFLEEYKSTPHLSLDVSERIIIEVTDKNGKSIPNGELEIRAGGNLLEQGKTLADGRYLFFPSEYPAGFTEFEVRVRAQQEKVGRAFTREGERIVPVSVTVPRYTPRQIPLDILFIMDTTGSMGEEIDRLRTTIELIHLNLTNLSVKPRVRFGMVLYKDKEDEYRTRIIPLTDNLEKFQAALDLVEASGGGDTPEDLQAALEDSIRSVRWDPDAVKLGFIITDAPPHLDYGQEFTYTDAARNAKSAGIKFFGIGTGGLSINGEYVLRQISQYTSGKYIFLTYGERGESEGGAPGSVSHHTGSNFQTDKLEAIIIRFAKEELSYLTDEPIEAEVPYFVASKIDAEKREETVDKLFSMALEQLIDYATLRIDTGTPTALIPVIASEEEYSIDAEYFSERLLQQTITNPSFRVVERRDIQSILDELKLQLSGLTDNTQAVKVGELMHADLILTGTLYRRPEEFEMFIKLLRVESGEILSLTKARIDTRLGLSGN